MKSSLLLLAALFGAATAASAQTAPALSTPRTPNSASPSAVPSGMSPSNTTNSVGPVSPGEVFTKGDPANQKMRDQRTKGSGKMKGHRKMKSEM